MIDVKGIKKAYGQLEVLKGVDLKVDEKEIVAIVGKSGAGKSTLLHIMGALDKPDVGTLAIDGQEITPMGKNDLAKFRNEKIGFIFQFHHLLPEFNALENVCIPAYIKGTSMAEMQGRAKELLAYLGLSDRLDHKPNQMSGGEQQRVAVARALINNPKVVFADEPSGNLDSATSKELHNLLFDLRKDFNQTFVIVTHNEELAHMSDRRLTMKDGQIIG
jgi:lipoprotein-releasing system ATP-binding protein